jgi:prepilin signal peptidase PulO-like enzyme (type II secretory pathway)
MRSRDGPEATSALRHSILGPILGLLFNYLIRRITSMTNRILPLIETVKMIII